MKRRFTYRIIIIAALLLAGSFAFAQKDSLVLLKKISVTATDFVVDPLGNFYFVTASDQIKKVNDKGDSLGVFNLTKKYGKLSYIDVSNPLKVLLFFKDYSTLITIDRFMNVINTIDLRKKNIYQLKAVTTSYDNQLWFYDEQDAKIKKMNDNGQVTAETVDLRQQLDELPSPEVISDREGLLYLYDSAKGVYVFDYYGTLKTHIPITGWSNFHAFNKTVYGTANGCLMKHALNSPLTGSTPLQNNVPPFTKMEVIYGRVYFLHAGGVSVFAMR
jgi:hypothetical protein